MWIPGFYGGSVVGFLVGQSIACASVAPFEWDSLNKEVIDLYRAGNCGHASRESRRATDRDVEELEPRVTQI